MRALKGGWQRRLINEASYSRSSGRYDNGHWSKWEILSQ